MRYLQYAPLPVFLLSLPYYAFQMRGGRSTGRGSAGGSALPDSLRKRLSGGGGLGPAVSVGEVAAVLPS
jgi:hypothetical protein